MLYFSIGVIAIIQILNLIRYRVIEEDVEWHEKWFKECNKRLNKLEDICHEKQKELLRKKR